jgi:two-component system, NtrC family, sensor histidine kinase HydH
MLKKFLNKSLKFQILFIVAIVISVPIVVTAWNVLTPSNVSNTLKSMHEERLKNLLVYFDENLNKQEIYNLKNLKNSEEKLQNIEESLKVKLEPHSRLINGTRLGIYIISNDKNYTLGYNGEDKIQPRFRADFPPEEIKVDLERDINETIRTKEDNTYYKTDSKFEMLRCLRPVILNGEVIAVIWDEVVLPPNLNAIRRSITYTFVLAIFGLTLGLSLMLIILRNLNMNVLKIRTGLEKVSDNLSYRIEDMGGDLGKIAGSINKMTETLEQKEKLEEQLVRADKLASLGHMISGVAHEIRNPLGIIRGTVQLMERDFKKIKGIEEYIRIIKEQSDRENRVIQELLDYARPSRQILSEADINSLINSVLAFTNKYMQEKQIRFELMLKENLPSFIIDSDKIKQVFVNVIINACEAMEKGGTLSISTEVDTKYIKIYFQDTGIGMEEQQIKNIFNPYFSTKPNGTGLGLSISNGIVEMHGGSIEVSSKKGEGSTFIINLPYNNKDGEVSG